MKHLAFQGEATLEPARERSACHKERMREGELVSNWGNMAEIFQQLVMHSVWAALGMQSSSSS
jgi:hypothetical protein